MPTQTYIFDNSSNTVNGDLGNNYAITTHGIYATGVSSPLVISNNNIYGNMNSSTGGNSVGDYTFLHGIYITGSTSTMTIQGNNINVYSGDQGGIDDDSESYGIYIADSGAAGSSIISGNTVYGGKKNDDASGSGSGQDWDSDYYGIYISKTNAGTFEVDIYGNNIIGGYDLNSQESGTNPESNGIHLVDSGSGSINADIYNNIIETCRTTSAKNYIANGIYINGTSPNIWNNTLFIEGAGISRGIYLTNISHPKIENNIIHIETGYSSYCVYEDHADADPEEMNNNALYHVDTSNGNDGYYYDDAGSIVDDLGTTDITLYDPLAPPTPITGTLGSFGNINPNMKTYWTSYSLFNYTLSTGTPSSVYAGGLDGTAQTPVWGFTDDYAGTNRLGNGTTGWSMGAYEYDLTSVYSTSPAGGATGVGVGTLISVTFSVVMNPGTITVNTGSTVCSGTIQVSADSFATCVRWAGAAATGDNITFTVDPLVNLSAASPYQIRVTTAATSEAGYSLGSQFTSTGFSTP